MSSNICIIYVPCPSREVAESIGKNLVEQALAACVNILPVMQSIYLWDNKLTRDEESLLLVKTLKVKELDVRKAILANHPYETPAVLTLDVLHANPEYLRWMADQIKS